MSRAISSGLWVGGHVEDAAYGVAHLTDVASVELIQAWKLRLRRRQFLTEQQVAGVRGTRQEDFVLVV